MKYLILFLLLTSCANWTTSKHRCDNKVGIEKEACLESYDNYVRHRDYRHFRGGAGRNHFDRTN